jgi:hypothetical protein
MRNRISNRLKVLIVLAAAILMPARLASQSGQQPRVVLKLEAVDSLNKVVGNVCADRNGPFAVLCYSANSVSFRLPLDRNGFVSQGETFFASPNCAPPAIMPAGTAIYPTANVVGASLFVEDRSFAPQGAVAQSKRDLAGACVTLDAAVPLANARPAFELSNFNTFVGPFRVREVGSEAPVEPEPPVAVLVSLQTSPAGATYSVDGVTYSSAQTFEWIPGSMHTVDTLSLQPGAPGVQYVFDNWSDGGEAGHSLLVPASPVTLTANFKTQYRLTTTIVPLGGGVISPASNTFYDSGQTVTLQATPNTGYAFGGWAGPVGLPSSAATSVTMSSPTAVTANFATTIQLLTNISLTRLANGTYLATVVVTNNGTGAAENVRLTTLLMNSTAGTGLPRLLGAIAPLGGTATAAFTFPATLGNPGALVLERYSGTYTGGTFSGSVRVALPQ